MKSAKAGKIQKVILSLSFAWLLACIGTTYLPSKNFLHNLGYVPPLALCLPFLVVLAITLYHIIRRQSSKLDWASLVIGLIAVIAVSGFSFPNYFFVAHGYPINILTINVEFTNRNVPGLAEYIRNQKVDIVLMQEVKGGNLSPAAKIIKEFPDWHIAAIGELAILSRWPLSDVQSVPLRSLPNRFILSAKATGRTTFRVMTTHWSVPQITKGATKLQETVEAQRKDFDDTLRRLESESLPFVIGGDFNNPPRHSFSRTLSGKYEDAFSSVGLGWGYTYPSRLPVVRIDHLFSSQYFKATKAMVGPSFGSDHRSLFARYILEAF